MEQILKQNWCVYEGAQGTPISYVYNDNGRLLQDTFSNSALIFVPATQSQINLVNTTVNSSTTMEEKRFY
jgi:hypothetical protein